MAGTLTRLDQFGAGSAYQLSWPRPLAQTLTQCLTGSEPPRLSRRGDDFGRPFNGVPGGEVLRNVRPPLVPFPRTSCVIGSLVCWPYNLVWHGGDQPFVQWLARIDPGSIYPDILERVIAQDPFVFASELKKMLSARSS